MSWEEYRRRARLLAAVELIATSRVPIGRVAAELGYESQSAFAKVFRAFLGDARPHKHRSVCQRPPPRLPATWVLSAAESAPMWRDGAYVITT
jgi:transcriptional regulator GlxA family with amidase domain